jgi:hypothetical protein
MGYPAQRQHPNPSAEELRSRIPGWGADLDPADRPSYPKERFAPEETGAHWDIPEDQPNRAGRERSNEHAFLTPVFGTAQPLHGISGAIRRRAYERYSEGTATHWLLLIAGDRVESAGAHLKSFVSRRPDDPITQSGVLGEPKMHPISSRVGHGRVDLRHTWIDPLLVVGPWVLSAVGAIALVRRVTRRRR